VSEIHCAILDKMEIDAISIRSFDSSMKKKLEWLLSLQHGRIHRSGNSRGGGTSLIED